MLIFHAGRRADFTIESRNRLWISEGVRREEFDRDAFVELDMVSRNDDPHAACADDSFEAITSRYDVALAKIRG
jgi:hypothetical protein